MTKIAEITFLNLSSRSLNKTYAINTLSNVDVPLRGTITVTSPSW
jgi:hypothetical protein